MYDEFAALIDHLIDFNRRNRVEWAEARAQMPKVLWAMQFCTVHCDVGRGCGKTSYIWQRATASDLILVPRGSLMENVRWRVGRDRVVHVTDPFQFQQHTDGRQFKVIYIDEPSAVFEQIRAHEVYRALACTGDETFVLLGR